MFWPTVTVRFVKQACMALTMGCGLYVIYSLLSGNPVSTVAINHDNSVKDFSFLQPMPILEAVAVPHQARDIFSMGSSAQESVENTPAGQLPNHLKIVGIVIADRPQVIIEDSLTHQTYFIEPHHPEAGISMLQANAHQIIMSYQGNVIPIAIKRNEK